MSDTNSPDQNEFKPEDASYESRYTQAYSDAGFWEMLEANAVKAGREAVSAALDVYYTLNQSSLPKWASAMALTALGYFILPSDAIPDMLPVVGYADDLGVLVAAADCISTFTTVEITAASKEKLSGWFGETEES